MDGKRGLRAAGTDGSDYSFRQVLDRRYDIMAAAKSRLRLIGMVHFALAALLAYVCLTDEAAIAGVPLSFPFRASWPTVVAIVAPLGTLHASRGVTSTLHIYTAVCAAIGVFSLVFVVAGLAKGNSLFPVAVHALGAAVGFGAAHAGKELADASGARANAGVRVSAPVGAAAGGPVNARGAPIAAAARRPTLGERLGIRRTNLTKA